MNAQTSFVNELDDLIDSYNGLISYAELIGLLEALKFDLMMEMVDAKNGMNDE